MQDSHFFWPMLSSQAACFLNPIAPRVVILCIEGSLTLCVDSHEGEPGEQESAPDRSVKLGRFDGAGGPATVPMFGDGGGGGNGATGTLDAGTSATKYGGTYELASMSCGTKPMTCCA